MTDCSPIDKHLRAVSLQFNIGQDGQDVEFSADMSYLSLHATLLKLTET